MSDTTLAKIKGILEGCNAWSNDAAWQIPKSSNWAIKHKALEIVAAAKGIAFDLPTVLEDNALERVSMIVTGRMGDRSEWSVGECSRQNYKAFTNAKMAAYPWAMAEKRAKDRVILKLVGLHGYAYSEDEAEEFKRGEQPQKPPAEEDPFEPTDDELTEKYQDALTAIEAATNRAELSAAGKKHVDPIRSQLSGPEKDAIKNAGDTKAASFKEQAA